MPWSPTSWNRRMPCFRQKSRIVWCIFAISGVGGGTQWSSVTTIFSGSQTFIVPISLNGRRASASISCMYNRSTSPSTIWPGRTDSAWLARAKIFSDIVWPVIEIGECTGAAEPINMAMDGPKVLRDGGHRGPMASSSTRSAAFAMLCLIWGSTWLAIRIGLEGAPPFLSASLRFAVASLVLVVLAVVFRSKWPQNRTEWALVGFVGIVLFTADYGLIYWGENNGVLSGLSAILFATFPLQTALVANAFLKAERFTVQKLLGISVGFGGVVLIFRSQLGTAGPGQVFPMLSIVLAATCAAFATVAVKRWGHDTEPISFNAAAMAVGAARLASVSLITREPWGIPTWPQSLGAVLYLAVAGSVVTFLAWQWVPKGNAPTSPSLIAFVIPLVAGLLGGRLGHRAVGLIGLPGGGHLPLGNYRSPFRPGAPVPRAAEGPRRREASRRPRGTPCAFRRRRSAASRVSPAGSARTSRCA